MKLNISNNLTTAKSLDKSIQEIELIETAPNSYLNNYQQLMLSISGSDYLGGAQASNNINSLKESYISNSMLLQVAGSNLQALGALDWTDPANFQLVYGTLLGIANGAGQTLSQQKDNMKETINVLTNSMGLATYETFVNQTLYTLNENLNKVNEGLIEVEKGQLSAAIEFANAASSIQLGEYQMDLAKTQLDSALEQILSGEEQLLDANEQLAEGEEQLAEAKKEAYNAANMEAIVTIDMIKGLLTAQNFSMPAGYVMEDGIDYLVRVGHKLSSMEQW